MWVECTAASNGKGTPEPANPTLTSRPLTVLRTAVHELQNDPSVDQRIGAIVQERIRAVRAAPAAESLPAIWERSWVWFGGLEGALLICAGSAPVENLTVSEGQIRQGKFNWQTGRVS